MTGDGEDPDAGGDGATDEEDATTAEDDATTAEDTPPTTDDEQIAPNRNALWARVIVEELVAAGVDAACISPGSRSTPLTVACYEHDDLRVFSHLDERSAAYFALGRARRTGTPTPLVCTSGTAAANFHPAVVEADTGRVPMLLLTADRPPELRDSGANQTVDQVDLYGDAVRWFRDLPEPEPADRTLRRLRVDVARAVGTARGTPPGPVHVNVPFRKPLEPVEVVDERLAAVEQDGAAQTAGADDADTRTDVDDADARTDVNYAGAGTGFDGRVGAYARWHAGTASPPADSVDALADDVAAAERVLLVAGPATAGGEVVPGQDPTAPDVADALAALADATGAPLLADQLSGVRFGEHLERAPLVCGGYDAYCSTAAVDAWPDPQVVLRVGASPTSKPLRKYLAATDARHVVVDPAGEWPEAEFVATDLVAADPARTCRALATALADRDVDPDASGRATYREAFARAEAEHWALVEAVAADGVAAGAEDSARDAARHTARGAAPDADPNGDDVDLPEGATVAGLEGSVVTSVIAALPDRATLFASNSMPVRDLDRFAPPGRRELRALGNRGASGIDGVVSTALGAASAGSEPLVALVGDLALYHDLNGLLAAERCGVDATIVVVNNDGGGIFHALPIEAFDPPFTEGFRTPHGLDFAGAAETFGVDHSRVAPDELSEACEDAVGGDGVQLLEVGFDAETSHRAREALGAALAERVRAATSDLF